MPGLALTVAQASRFWSVSPETCQQALEQLVRADIEQMVDDHDDTVELFQDQSDGGDDPQLKKWATDKLPALREQLRMAQQLRDELNSTRQ
jgi:predicted outer membrane protein